MKTKNIYCLAAIMMALVTISCSKDNDNSGYVSVEDYASRPINYVTQGIENTSPFTAVAYEAEGEHTGDFMTPTEFVFGNYYNYGGYDKNLGSIYKDSFQSGTVWPRENCTLNFLQLTGFDNIVWGQNNSNLASKAVATISTNGIVNGKQNWNQKNCAYGCTQNIINWTVGRHSNYGIRANFNYIYSKNTFEIKADREAEVIVNKITLKGASYNGTLEIVNPNYTQSKDTKAAPLQITWKEILPGEDMIVPNKEQNGPMNSTPINTSYTKCGGMILTLPVDNSKNTIEISYLWNGSEKTAVMEISGADDNNERSIRITLSENPDECNCEIK